jgi:hypothetical protein
MKQKVGSFWPSKSSEGEHVRRQNSVDLALSFHIRIIRMDLPRKSGEFLMKDEELHVEAETFYERV